MDELISVNPATGERIGAYPVLSAGALEASLARAEAGFSRWAAVPLGERVQALERLAALLRSQQHELARQVTAEMGKRFAEARAEVEKCAFACDYYAAQGPGFLADETVDTAAGRSLIAWHPLGPILLVMPWNFPYWQVLRQAIPATLAGNTVLLKHAANVPGCAAALERIFREAGYPEGVFGNLAIRSGAVAGVIADPRVRGVSLTGSEGAGRAVASAAGKALKKTVLELGGSDAFIVLADADLDGTVEQALRARFQNNGETCIAAKRFIVEAAVADDFVAGLQAGIERMKVGDPMAQDTDLGPLARADLCDELHRQVTRSVAAGAVCRTGGQRLERPGFYYAPTLLDRVVPGMAAFEEETFGPVAAVTRAADADEAVRLANASRYGLGGSVWTRDRARGEALARRLECGCAFVNGIVRSDPRLPFGGIKDSGYGRELGLLGIREFVNAKSLWID
ncbi:NAD-dependent succinate-semialdehyde dehydrogenase [Thioalkalivibrio paradoxus]|uniref:Succinate-semialdehyde dehdyrogenase n=1 Tax=Thioalkalivibrio paradoxus ARh 1 TaxID=713585 RepID=W0DIR7_9GAMM|nr:NAD-dependent succinate-semialdehyde dehydrogenase [Thioalkalivibrio paradoxus]AHE97142.1 succinate-semialdehyde dehdyrogenase [Thioalkalivibrio paradoxus ARh 1]